MGAPWFFVPTFGALADNRFWASVLAVASPFFAPFHLGEHLGDGDGRELIFIAEFVNLALAIALGAGAIRLRARLEASVRTPTAPPLNASSAA